MLHRIHVKKAPTAKDLLEQVDAATHLLGLDAMWTGHKDGRIYLWREGHYVDMGIEPKTKYLFVVDREEIFR